MVDACNDADPIHPDAFIPSPQDERPLQRNDDRLCGARRLRARRKTACRNSAAHPSADRTPVSDGHDTHS